MYIDVGKLSEMLRQLLSRLVVTYSGSSRCRATLSAACGSSLRRSAHLGIQRLPGTDCRESAAQFQWMMPAIVE
jgi:hypothetical protein